MPSAWRPIEGYGIEIPLPVVGEKRVKSLLLLLDLCTRYNTFLSSPGAHYILRRDPSIHARYRDICCGRFPILSCSVCRRRVVQLL